MLRNTMVAISAALLTFASQGPATAEGPAELPRSIDWTIAPAGDGEPEDEVQFSLSYRSSNSQSMWSNTTALSQLDGLQRAQLQSRDGTPVHFQIIREAGRFDCEGIVRRERGTGECRFSADQGFAAALAERGIGQPSEGDQFRLALARVGIELVDTLDQQHYARPSMEDLMRAGIHEVTPAYVRAMTTAGYHVGDVDGLVQMRIHGVTPDYVEALARAGYRPDAEMVTRLAIHGVSTDFIAEMGALGYARLDAEDLVALRIHDVSPGYVRALAALGYRDLSAEQLKRMRIHDVSPEFVRAHLRSDPRPSAEELISLRIHGG